MQSYFLIFSTFLLSCIQSNSNIKEVILPEEYIEFNIKGNNSILNTIANDLKSKHVPSLKMVKYNDKIALKINSKIDHYTFKSLNKSLELNLVFPLLFNDLDSFGYFNFLEDIAIYGTGNINIFSNIEKKINSNQTSIGYFSKSDTAQLNKTIELNLLEFHKHHWNRSNKKDTVELYISEKKEVKFGIKNITPQIDLKESFLFISLTKKASDRFYNFTANNIGRVTLFKMEETVYWAPVISGVIPNGNILLNIDTKEDLVYFYINLLLKDYQNSITINSFRLT